MARIAYEDLLPGNDFDLGTGVVDKDEMIAFNRRFDPQPFHIDEDAARESLFGALCASGWFTASLWMRAYVDTLLLDSTSKGSPGGREMAWPAPVYAGDELHFWLHVDTARRSASRPGLGLVDIVGSAYRADTCVLRMAFTGIFGCRT